MIFLVGRLEFGRLVGVRVGTKLGLKKVFGLKTGRRNISRDNTDFSLRCQEHKGTL